jgi:hypothetical protein
LCLFGTFYPVLVSCTKKNLATLIRNAPEIIRGPQSEKKSFPFASKMKKNWRTLVLAEKNIGRKKI